MAESSPTLAEVAEAARAVLVVPFGSYVRWHQDGDPVAAAVCDEWERKREHLMALLRQAEAERPQVVVTAGDVQVAWPTDLGVDVPEPEFFEALAEALTAHLNQAGA